MYLHLAALAALWNMVREFLMISYETCNLSFFHLRSACLQACLRERVVSLCQNTCAILFKMKAQVELK